MLVGFIAAYLAASIAAATVFATWFGAETVLGIPATFLKEGLRGLVADPFAAVACLAIVGLAFARPLFRLDCLTLGDYFRARFGPRTEVLLSLAIAFSYLGWIAAQLVALGLAFDVLSADAIDTRTGIVIGAGVVVLYTMAGGMWSVALTDTLQAALIIAGLAYVAWMVAGLAGGASRVIDAAAAADRLRFLPEPDTRSILAWVTAALIVALGSVPQQDVFQRVRSARSESVAIAACLLGGAVYFAIAMLPIFLVAAATLIDAPMGDRGALLTTRLTVLALAGAVTVMALTSRLSIYQLVNESGKVVLVSAFVPLAAGLFWPRADARGAMASFVAGLATWLTLEAVAADATVPPALAGFIAAVVAMAAGSMLPARRS